MYDSTMSKEEKYNSRESRIAFSVAYEIHLLMGADDDVSADALARTWNWEAGAGRNEDPNQNPEDGWVEFLHWHMFRTAIQRRLILQGKVEPLLEGEEYSTRPLSSFMLSHGYTDQGDWWRDEWSFKPSEFPVLDEHEIAAFAECGTWHYAKTMPECPHWYVIRRECDEEQFEAFVRRIRSSGFICRWQDGPMRRYYAFKEYYYWTMGSPVGETTIINRCLQSDYSINNGHVRILL